jgi:hypothetical protein
MTKSWCQGFCRLCGTGCGQYCEEITSLKQQLTEARAEIAVFKSSELGTRICELFSELGASKDKLSQAQAEIQAMEHVVGALKDIAGRKLYPGVAEQMRDDAKEALTELDKVREGKK